MSTPPILPGLCARVASNAIGLIGFSSASSLLQLAESAHAQQLPHPVGSGRGAGQPCACDLCSDSIQGIDQQRGQKRRAVLVPARCPACSALSPLHPWPTAVLCDVRGSEANGRDGGERAGGGRGAASAHSRLPPPAAAACCRRLPPDAACSRVSLALTACFCLQVTM